MLVKAVLKNNMSTSILEDPVLKEKKRLIHKLSDIFSDHTLEDDIKNMIINNYITKLYKLLNYRAGQKHTAPVEMQNIPPRPGPFANLNLDDLYDPVENIRDLYYEPPAPRNALELKEKIIKLKKPKMHLL